MEAAADETGISAPAGRNSSQSLRRAIGALNAVAAVVEREGRGCSMQDLVEETGLARSTLYRLLAPLVETGLVERFSDKTYRIGPYAAFLGGMYLDQLDLRAMVRPHLEDLNARTRETVHLLLRTGTSVIYIDKIESPAVLRMHSRVGGLMPMYCTSAGKAMLAHLPEAVVADVVAAGLDPRTPATIVDEQELRRELAVIRELGYAVDDIENEPGIRCVGAAVFSETSSPAAAISVAGPADRITPELVPDLGETLAREAALISKRLSASQSTRNWA